MIPIERDDIQIISRNSNWPERQIDETLREHVYNGAEAWKKFLKLFFISLGVCFTTSGIIFFFAYNWDDLSGFTKIGLMQGLIVVSVLCVLLLRINLLFRNILLTGAAMLVGVLFAVFGQIYQTGANAYDFFLSWTLCIALWVAVSNFPPLWLIFIALINTTVILFVIQVGQYWEGITIFTVLFAINGVYLAKLMVCDHFVKGVHLPGWLRNTLGIVTAFYATVGVCMGINRAAHGYYFRLEGKMFALICVLVLIAYTAAMLYSFKKKSGFFIALVLSSLVVIITDFLLNVSSNSAMFLFASMFVIGGVTGIIGYLLYLQRKWTHE